MSTCPSTKHAMLAKLSSEVRSLELSGCQASDQAAISTGCQAMDACLPNNGYTAGSIIEYLRATSGCGAGYLALAAASAALQAAVDKYLVIVDSHQQFYPPALRSHQIALPQVIWVRPENQLDTVWVIDQALRTSSVAAVIADIENLDQREARRLQLAAQHGGGLGLLLRGLSARHLPSWAEVQWVVRSMLPTRPAVNQVPETTGGRPLADPVRSIEVQLARLRAGRAGARLLLDLDTSNGTLHPAQRQRNHYERHQRPMPHRAQQRRSRTG